MKKVINWWRKRNAGFKISCIFLVFIFITGPILTPLWIKKNVLSKLNQIKGFKASMEKVEVSLFSPSITFHHVKLFSTETACNIPLFKADQIKGELMLCSIDEGKLLTHSTISNPILTFFQFIDTVANTEEIVHSSNYKYADSVNWGEEIGKLFALTINEFDIENGAINFRNTTYGNEIVLKSDSIYTHINNIANSEHKEMKLFSSGKLTARLMEHAFLTVDLKMAPADSNASFDLNISLRNLDITTMNQFWRKYANLDVERGHFSFESNLEIRNGMMVGSFEPHSDDFDIFKLKYDENLGYKNMTWQALVELATKIFLLGDRNEDKVCRVDFNGTLKQMDFTLRKNSEALLSKMFVKAVNTRLKTYEVTFEKID